jgi:hypothetical protein
MQEKWVNLPYFSRFLKRLCKRLCCALTANLLIYSWSCTYFACRLYQKQPNGNHQKEILTSVHYGAAAANRLSLPVRSTNELGKGK